MRSKAIILSIIFIITLSLRIGTVFLQKESKGVPARDALQYDNLAVSIVSGNGLSEIINGKRIRSMHRMPLYPMFLAGIYTVFGHNYFAVKIIQAILGAFLCLIIYFITSQIYSKTTALLAALIVAIYKPFISGFNYYGGPGYLLSEYFYMFILGITFLIAMFFLRKENKIFGALFGLTMGLAILTRPEFALYPILLLVYFFCLVKFSIKKVFRRYLIIYIFIVLTLAPWVARNYMIEKKFIPLTTHGGLIFWHGNNSLARGGMVNMPPGYQEAIQRLEGISEAEQSKVFLKKGLNYLANNPKVIPKLFIKKVLVHWAPFEQGFRLFNVYYAIILLFAAVTFLFFIKYSRPEIILLVIFLSTTLVTIITAGDPRYRYPYEPFLIIFAAFGMHDIYKFIITKIKHWRYRQK
ncbi:ArnT family glycosyltransferase [Candidatus Omnitrophota bacterium]